MSVRNLEYLFHPRSVALIGASDTPHSVGAALLGNLLSSAFHGDVALVNPRHATLAGRTVYADVGALPFAPDLAVISTPPPAIPGLIAALGARGTRAAIVITAGVDVGSERGTPIRDAMLAAAKPHLLRILGPNCVGLLAPGIGLNASFAHVPALPGHIAFVSQSGALVTGVLDWARSRGIGFSRFISLGDAADVDVGDVLDYLASDAQTQSILLYVESIARRASSCRPRAPPHATSR
jgi:acetyltransferase